MFSCRRGYLQAVCSSSLRDQQRAFINQLPVNTHNNFIHGEGTMRRSYWREVRAGAPPKGMSPTRAEAPSVGALIEQVFGYRKVPFFIAGAAALL